MTCQTRRVLIQFTRSCVRDCARHLQHPRQHPQSRLPWCLPEPSSNSRFETFYPIKRQAHFHLSHSHVSELAIYTMYQAYRIPEMFKVQVLLSGMHYMPDNCNIYSELLSPSPYSQRTVTSLSFPISLSLSVYSI